MAKVPETVRIDDLAEPRMPAELRDFMRSMVAATPLEYSVDAVLSAAREQSGLEDFGTV